MSESDYKMVIEVIERLRLECDTPDKAMDQLKSEGLLDETGKTADSYRAD